MTDIKVVMGANFGDEGKGLMTDYFCHQATEKKQTCLVVMANGGAQRGHTVTTLDGKQHVFNHFGSGTFVGADTYCPKMFILNPLQFAKEYTDLTYLNIFPKIYYNINSRWSTPYDMIINQIVEASRGDQKHGSCGMGIWETVVRYASLTNPIIIPINEFNTLPFVTKCSMLRKVRDEYLPARLKAYGIDKIPAEWQDIVESDMMISRFIDDVDFFCTIAKPTFNDSLIKKYDRAVFENGQGLLLDQQLTELYGDNLTPSNTGAANTFEILASLDGGYKDIELCYVSRTYVTRHGAGKFLTECKKDVINATMFDETNVTNPFQDNLRYGELIVDNLVHRVSHDAQMFTSAMKLLKSPNIKTSVAMTHTNEHEVDYEKVRQMLIDNVYMSNSRTRESVTILR